MTTTKRDRTRVRMQWTLGIMALVTALPSSAARVVAPTHCGGVGGEGAVGDLGDQGSHQRP
ncbi:hypothetical protein [Rhodococcus opacus]|uniref:hypothetical protein n=1 Tax=Rhodococcus opacus TaxID=37919 RepID=UPI0029558473|nr:hypothetical protein [Rhodococcus opacus]MDV7085610.1 hypothetical protein [Rhodococcus opacus]